MKMPVKIGILINNKANKNLLIDWIGKKYEIIEIKRDSDLYEELDLIIIDGLNMKKFREKIKNKKSIESPVFFPVLFITNREDVKYITNQLWIVVDEIILTPIEKIELAARIEILLRTRKLSKMCQDLAITDPLTGLYNIRHFFKLAEIEISKLKRYKKTCSCLMIDLDHFKNINDTYGHIVGDKVLIEIGKRIKEGIRDYDILARYGGEEFIILLPDTDLENAIAVAERIRKNIASSEIEINDEVKIPITVSIGVASANGSDIILDELIKKADRALYIAKNSGRNKVRYIKCPCNCICESYP